MNERKATPSAEEDGGARVKTLALGQIKLADGSPAAGAADAKTKALVSDTRSIYALLSTIDQGGMGKVYLARDERLNRSVAVKVMLGHEDRDGAAVQRFVEEAQITSQLEHPNIVPLHELGVDGDGHLYFSMKLVKGETLGSRLGRWKQQPQLTPDLLYQALTIILKVLDALAFAHSRGVVHRDVKPANIMIGEYGEVLLMDWGIARVLAKSERAAASHRPAGQDRAAAPGGGLAVDSTFLTTDGDIVGTPGYMAPEQARGELAAIDQRADIYSIGAILYELLAGACPFQGKVTDVLSKAAKGEMVAPSKRSPMRQVPPELEAVTMKAMSLRPQNRYRAAKALADDLTSYLAGRSVSARPDPPLVALRKLAARNLPLVATIAGAIALLAVVSTILISHILHQQAANEQLAIENAGAQSEAEGAKHSRDVAIEAENARSQRRMNAFVPYAAAIDLLGRDGFVYDSIALLRKAIEIDHDFAEAHFALGRALVAAGDPGSAIDEFQTAEALSEQLLKHGNPRAVLSMAMAEDDVGILPYDEYGKLGALGKDDPYALLGRTFVASAEQDTQGMLDAGRRALQVEPRLWESHYAAGYAQLHAVIGGLLPRSRIDVALNELRAACTMEPHAVQPRMWLAKAEQLDGQAEAAWSHDLDLAIGLQQHNPMPLLFASETYLEVGEALPAREAMDRAERLSPPPAPWAAARSAYDAFSGHQDAAMEEMGDAARLMPIAMVIGAWLNDAAMLGKSDQVADQISRFRAANPAAPAVATMDWLLRSHGHDDEGALAIAESALVKLPYNYQLLLMRGMSQASLGRFDKALANVEAALGQKPSCSQAALLKAQLLVKLDRVKECKAFLVDFGTRYPSLARERLNVDINQKPRTQRPDGSPQPDSVEQIFGTDAK
jgi:serine/threonine protein kinase